MPGGRHPWGTANLIVPLGSEYLELIAVVDAAQAAASDLGRRTVAALGAGRTFAGWAVRTPDLDGTRRALEAAGWELPPDRAGSRQRPDGSLLSWRTQELEPPGAGLLPFLIEWGKGQPHPGSAPAQHPSGVRGIRRLVLGHPDPVAARDRVCAVLAADAGYEVRRSEAIGVLEVVLDTDRGELVIR